MSTVLPSIVANESATAPYHNHLLEVKSLPFEVLVMRHGPSVPNDRHQIISDLPNGMEKQYGLTAQGVEIVRQSVRAARKAGLLIEHPLIYCSPFSRTLDTAKAVCAELNLPESVVQVDKRLRERFFGKFNLGSTEHYRSVWEWDSAAPLGSAITEGRVETIYSVLERTSDVVAELARAWASNRGSMHQLLLVLHGDPASILASGMAATDPRQHRESFPPLRPAEIRRLTWQVSQ